MDNSLKTYLVTGGCGFIGSHLCDALLTEGHRVIVVDNLSTGYKSNLSPKAELVIGDIRDGELIKKITEKIDGCFHLAAVVSVEQCQNEWTKSHEVNSLGTIQIFNAARENHLRPAIPVVYASSCAVYGDNQNMPLSENECPAPLGPYAADKLSNELHGRIASRLFNVPTTGLRLFNVYGPRQRADSAYSGVISIFADRLRHNQPVEIHGDGEQTRDFIYVRDVIEFFLASMSQQNKQGEIYNACTGISTSIIQLAEKLANILNVSLQIQRVKSREGDVKRSRGNPDKALQRLHAQTKYSLSEGLKLLCAIQ